MSKHLMCVVAVALVAGRIYAQGSLNPSGAPAPTMKTLAQVEPRTAITNGPYTISQSGSYYLANNINATITIQASDVALDLMGFTVRSTSGNGIDLPSPSRTNIWIRNGTVRGCASSGIFAGYLRDSNSRFEDLSLMANGWAGLYAGSGCIIQNCRAFGNQRYGIIADSAAGTVVQDCWIVNNADTGLRLGSSGAYVANNIVKGNALNYFFAAGNQLNLLLCEIPETLRWPCSVKLAGTLSTSSTTTNGITVMADNVTIDLDGHALVGPGAGSKNGIDQPAIYRGLAVKNGMLCNWRGSGSWGVQALGDNAHFQSLLVTSNYSGLRGGNGSVISKCQAYGCMPGTGIQGGKGSVYSDSTGTRCGYGFFSDAGSVFNNCGAYSNNLDGISSSAYATLNTCVSTKNGRHGFSIGIDALAVHCASTFNGSNGFDVSSGGAVKECTASRNGGYGIVLLGQGVAERNHVDNNTLAGIRTVSSGYNKIIGNNLIANGSGIVVADTFNLVIQNKVNGATPYSIPANNATGILINAFSGGQVSGDPWANIRH